jgi:membrane fusion protein (multidrug efflux system)
MSAHVIDRTTQPLLERDTAAAPPTRRASLSRNHLTLARAALLAVLGIAWYGYDLVGGGRFIESTDDADVGGDVTVLAPKVSDLIDELTVTDNQQVHAGDLLVKPDDRDYRAALAKAQASVAGSQATLANLEANRRQQEARIAQAQAELTATAALGIRVVQFDAQSRRRNRHRRLRHHSE